MDFSILKMMGVKTAVGMMVFIIKTTYYYSTDKGLQQFKCGGGDAKIQLALLYFFGWFYTW